MWAASSYSSVKGLRRSQPTRVSSRGGIGHVTEPPGWRRPTRSVRSMRRSPVSGFQILAVESPLAVAMRPEVRLPLGVAFLRAGANLMVVPSTVFGALLGAGVQVPLSPRLALHLGVDATLWPTANISQVEGRTGLAVRF